MEKKFLGLITALITTVAIIGAYPVWADTDAYAVGKTQLVTYKAPKEVDISGTYTVKARPQGEGEDSWRDLDVYKVQVMSNGTRQAAMVYFDCDGPIEVQVTCIGGKDGR